MKGCWIEPIWPADDLSMKYHDLFMKYQYVSDFFIAFAYFSIPVELIYFVNKKAVFPYRWVLVQFGAFIILCGATHFISLWSFSTHSRTLAALMAVSKMCTALVSCATALMLVYVIPDLFSMKTRESYLKNKAEELDREMGISISEEEIGRHVRMLTHEIRSTLDRHTILKTTLFELARTLGLEECTLWMPTCSGLELQLSNSFRQGQLHTIPATVPIHLPLIMDVFDSEGPLVISSDSPVVMIRPHRGRYMRGEAAAVRVPLLNLSDFHINDGSEPFMRSYALMVLTLPYDGVRRWHDYELKLVNAVADQVAVALSHAAILEESMRAQQLLIEKNIELVVAHQAAETATHSWNDFIATTNHEMQTIMHDIVDLSSRLEETELTFEHRCMVNTIQRNSYLLHTLINDVLELSRLEDGSLNLDMRTFNLSALFRENIKFMKPIASGKKLSFSMSLSSDLPEYAVGDDKRLLQAALNLVDNAVKFTREGNIHVTLCLERPEYMRDPITPEFSPMYDNHHFYMRVQVRGTGENFDLQYNSNFTNSMQLDLGVVISRGLVNLMGGHLWIESERFGKESTVIFVVKLGFPGQANEQLFHLPSIETGDKGI